jgi:hypothetical protein
LLSANIAKFPSGHPSRTSKTVIYQYVFKVLWNPKPFFQERFWRVQGRALALPHNPKFEKRSNKELMP